MTFKITKRKLLKEVNNCMCHNWYYLIYGRIYNDEHTKYRRFKYIKWFDVFDMLEWLHDDNDDCTYTTQDVKNYLTELIGCDLELVNSFDDTEQFYEFCNRTIADWNKHARHY